MTKKFIILTLWALSFFFFLIVLPWFGHVFSNKGRFGHKRKLPGFFYFLTWFLDVFGKSQAGPFFNPVNEPEAIKHSWKDIIPSLDIMVLRWGFFGESFWGIKDQVTYSYIRKPFLLRWPWGKRTQATFARDSSLPKCHKHRNQVYVTTHVRLKTNRTSGPKHDPPRTRWDSAWCILYTKQNQNTGCWEHCFCFSDFGSVLGEPT